MASRPPVPDPLHPPSWPPQWARSIGFVVGLGLIGWEATVEHSANLFVYGIGFILTGLPVARGLEKVLDMIGNKK